LFDPAPEIINNRIALRKLATQLLYGQLFGLGLGKKG
jgi:hypothetical protein